MHGFRHRVIISSVSYMAIQKRNIDTSVPSDTTAEPVAAAEDAYIWAGLSPSAGTICMNARTFVGTSVLVSEGSPLTKSSARAVVDGYVIWCVDTTSAENPFTA